MPHELELASCTPAPLKPDGFNPDAIIPYGLTIEHIRHAMLDFRGFLGFVNRQLHSQQMPRLESVLMQANFSSIVSEFMKKAIPKYCPTIINNRHHNGHPDLIPAGVYADNAVLRGGEGIEVKASRYLQGWQGHNPEAIWLMIFVFDANRPDDTDRGIAPKPFRFVLVAGAQLELEDWSFSGRSEQSRRTITASVRRSGSDKMLANWIYKDSAP